MSLYLNLNYAYRAMHCGKSVEKQEGDTNNFK